MGTCRRKLNHEEEVDEGGETENDDQAQPQPVWQFNLRRISRWLPSLQVTVNYDHQPPAIIEDLRQTGSISMTTDNILDGQLDTNQNTDSDSEEGQSPQSLHRRTVSDGQIRQRY